MAYSSSKRDFLESPAADALRQELQAMVEDPSYNTGSSYSTLSPGGLSFVAKHIEYMANHLKMNHNQYVSNLRLMTRINGAHERK